MRLQVEQPALARAVQTAAMAIKRSHVPLLECVHLIAADSALHAVGTDMTTEAEGACEAAVSEAGSASVAAADLQRLVASVPAGAVISIAIDGDCLAVSGGRVAARLPVEPTDFPRRRPSGEEVEIPQAGEMLALCLPYASREEVRYYLRGIHFGRDAVAATDGYALIAAQMDGGPEGAIVPAESIPAIAKIIAAGGRMFIGPRGWRVDGEGAKASGPLIDGAFPDWRGAFPKGLAPMFRCGADDLGRAVDGACLGSAKAVLLTVGESGLTVSGHDFQRRGTTASVTVECEGSESAVLLNAKYLLRVCKSFSGSEIEVAGNSSAIVASPVGRPEVRAVVMAMRDPRARAPLSAERAPEVA